jgi:hypothetical protein
MVIKIKISYIFLIIIYSMTYPELSFANNTTLKIKQNSSSSILLSWEHDKIPQKQEITLSTSDGVFIKKVTPLSTITSTLIRNLPINKSYKVTMKTFSPDYQISENIYLYSPPSNVKDIAYTLNDENIILSWTPKKNNDILKITLFNNNIFYKNYSVAASSKGFSIPIPLDSNNLYIEYYNTNFVGKSNKEKLYINNQITKINSITENSYINNTLNFTINSTNSNEYIIELYKNNTLIDKFLKNIKVIDLQLNNDINYNIHITPLDDKGKQGETYIYNFYQKNNSTENKGIEKTEYIDNENKEKINESKTTELDDINSYKIIQIKTFQYTEGTLYISWKDPFQQKYLIQYRDKTSKPWVDLINTENKDILLKDNLKKGFFQIRILGFVDGIKISESSIRSIIIRD